MEKEKMMAMKHGYSDPINESHGKTGEMYEKVVGFLMQQPNTFTVIATHNEASVQHLVKQSKAEKHEKAEIAFAQIYGMGEQITMPLGK